MRKEILTISEFASLRGITAETLRHYDRIGLLKPAFIDSSTGYRYYSILQYEQLSTILELRQMGMSLSEIRNFFEDRNPHSALELLTERKLVLQAEIQKLRQLETAVSSKISHLEDILSRRASDPPRLVTLPERKALVWKTPLDSDVDIGYGFADLEEHLNEVAPIFAANRYGLLMPASVLKTGEKRSSLLLFTDEPAHLSGAEAVEVRRIPGGLYASALLYQPETGDLSEVKRLSRSYQSQGYSTEGEIIFISQIDLSVTGCRDQVLYEVQLPLVPCI